MTEASPWVKRDCGSSHSPPWPHVHPFTHFVLAEYGGVVHDSLRVCSIPGHHHDPKLPDDHLHLRATQSVESFIANPHKTCHCLPTPPCPMKAGPWSGGRWRVILRLCQQPLAETWNYLGKWLAVDEIKGTGLNPISRCRGQALRRTCGRRR